MSQTSFFSSRAARTFALVLIFGAALAIRLYDLTDLPLDFHPTRQLVSFIKARGFYYKTKPSRRFRLGVEDSRSLRKTQSGYRTYRL